MDLNKKKQQFLTMYAIKGKSFEAISAELEVPTETLFEWKFELDDKIDDLKMIEYEKIIEKCKLSDLERFKYWAQLYSRLTAELDKRDFTGLPTDKLYYMLTMIEEKLNAKPETDDIDDWDDYPSMTDLNDIE